MNLQNLNTPLKYQLRILLVIVFFAMRLPTFAQSDFTINIQHFGIEEGLSHRRVHCAFQDKRGLMWFGTNYGLNRFDGYNFKWFTYEKNGLQSNIIEKILEDYQGNMWLMYGSTKVYANFGPNVSNIDIFNPVTERVQSFADYFADKTKLSPQSIVNFAQKENGEILMLTKGFQLITYTKKGEFTTINLNKNYYSITNFHHSKNGYLWFKARKENRLDSPLYVIALNEKGQEIRAFPLKKVTDNVFFYEHKNSTHEYWINLKEDNNGEQYFCEFTNKGELIETKNGEFENFNLDFKSFGTIAGMVDDGDYYWLFSNDGFYFINKKTKEKICLNKTYETHKNIAFAYQIFIDKQGQKWVSTQFGIYLINVKSTLFSKMFYSEDGLNPTRGITMFDDYIFFLHEDLKHIWKYKLSTDKKTVLSKEMTKEDKNGQNSPFLGTSYPLEKTRDNFILKAAQGNLSKINPLDFSFQYWKIKELDEELGVVWSLYEDKYGKYWFGYEKGMLGYLDNGQYRHLINLDSAVIPMEIYQFLEKEGDEVYVITKAGIFILDVAKKKITGRYWKKGKEKFHLPFDEIFHAYKDKDGSLWLGTNNHGLLHFNPKNGQYEQFTQVDGLSNNVIYAIHEDDFNNLWLSSDYGIMRFNKATKQVNSYQIEDGISHNEFNRVSHYQHEDGTMFFGSLNGITVFHPRDFQNDVATQNLPLIITDFQQFVGKEKKLVDKTQHLLSNKKIILAPDDLFFRLEFALLSYENLDRIRYAYQIEGTNDWIYQKSNYIRISRLSYGNHILKIKAQSANGTWTTNILKIEVVVNRPFYQTGWFILMLILALISGIFFIYKWRISRLKKRQTELEKTVAERTKKIQQDKITIEEQAEALKSLEALKSRFFTNVSHELRTPLTLMLGPINSLLKKEAGDKDDLKLLELAHRNGTDLLKLVNEILDLSKLEVGKLSLNFKNVLIYEYLEEKLTQFYSFAVSKGIKIKLDYQANRDLILNLDIEKTDKILINFLSNAIKFTPTDGQVTIRVKTKEDAIIFAVKDTGAGIYVDDLPYVFNRFYQSKHAEQLEKGGTGIGLALCKELANLMKGSVWVESELGKGSTFYFELPIELATVAMIDSDKFSSEMPLVYSKPTPITSSSTISQKLATILLVEDNPDLQTYIQYILNDYTVITADNGQVALDILKTENTTVDLIISDLMMPVMDGFELVERLKNDDNYRHLPMIMLTAKANVNAKIKALRIGIDDYMLKPFKEEVLITRIENLLANTKMRVQLSEETVTEKEIIVTEKEVTSISAEDAAWLENLEKIVLENIGNTNYTVERLADDLLMSKSSLNRQLKKIVGLSPNKYMVEVRLQKARELLENQEVNSVKAAAYSIGFLKIDYFSKIFQEKYGVSPNSFFE